MMKSMHEFMMQIYDAGSFQIKSDPFNGGP